MLRLHNPVRIALLIASFTLGAFAEDRYLVKVNGDVHALARKYGLTVVHSMGGTASGKHILATTAKTPQGVLDSLAADIAIVSAEPDKPVTLPGIKAAASIIRPSSTAGTFSVSSTLVKVKNSYVSSAYLTQPATNVINLSAAQKLATGAGIVATIDTGADFSHIGLVSCLVSGWDFVNNLPTGQEQADVNNGVPGLAQETTPILDQETTPILDGGTAVILTQETTPILDQ
jgi:hypothetical protein